MNTAAKKDLGSLSMLFEMTREDNPRLFDDLIRFNKGTKRVNRLRFVAHEGLLAQCWPLMLPAAGRIGAMAPGAAMPANAADPALAGAIFGPPLTE